MAAYIKTIGDGDNYLFKEQEYDKAFLKEKDREVFIIIKKEDTSLKDKTDEELKQLNLFRYEYIEGRVTGGSGNIDGASAVRRTCSSISIVSNQTNIHEYSWAMHTDIRIYIGIRNAPIIQKLKSTDSLDAVLYFDMGTYALSSFSISQNVNSSNITVSGKDKMCLLNGELGGLFTVDTELDKDVDGNTKTLFEIGESLLGLAGITNYNIDALKEQPGRELLEYRGNSPLYLLMNKATNENGEEYYEVDNLTIFGDQLTANGTPIGNLVYGKEPIQEQVGNTEYIQKIEYGEIAGYRWCDLIYPGSLTAAAGESIASIFEKIKNVLGAYEYFFDIDGKFWFKKQDATLDIQVNDENKIVGSVNSDISTQYDFEDLSLFTSLSNSPAMTNFKNDFIIRGNRKSVSGENKIPIHSRYAIIEWPKRDGEDIYSETNTRLQKQAAYCELIYSWAKEAPEFPNYWSDINKKYYQTFASDLLAFWRDIYNPEVEAEPIETAYDVVGDNAPNVWYGISPVEIIKTKEDGTEKNNDTIISELSQKYFLTNIFVKVPKEGEGETGFNYCKFYDYYTDLTSYPDVYRLEGTQVVSVYNELDYANMEIYIKNNEGYNTIPQILKADEQSNIYVRNIDKDTGFHTPYLEYININQVINECTNENTTKWLKNEIEPFGLWVKQGAGKYIKVNTFSYNELIAAPEILGKEFWQTTFNDTQTKLYFNTTNGGPYTQITSHQFFIKQPRKLNYHGYRLYMQVSEIDQETNKEFINYMPLVSWGLENKKFNKNQMYVKNAEGEYIHLLDLIDLDKSSKLFYDNTLEGASETTYGLIVPNCIEDIGNKEWFVFNHEGTLQSIEGKEEYLKLPYFKCKADGSLNTNMTYYHFCPCFYLESEYYLPEETYAGWKKAYIEDPSLLPYELILIDPNRQGNDMLKEYTIPKVGYRQKVENNNAVTAVRFNETPLLFFKSESSEYIPIENLANDTDFTKSELYIKNEAGEYIKATSYEEGQTYYQYKKNEGFQMPEDTKHLFVISSQGQSAQQAAAQALYNFTYCTETISATIWPFYDLEPNKRISITYKDEQGENSQKETYIVSKISFSLTYNGMMNLTLIRDPITRLKESSDL